MERPGLDVVAHPGAPQAPAQLAGGLARERQGEGVLRVGRPDGDAVGDAAGEHACLARSCAGDDGDQRRWRRDGRGLRRIELDSDRHLHGLTLRPGRYCLPMPYPKKLLNDRETLVLDLHPHWWYFVEAAIALGAAIVLGILALAGDWPTRDEVAHGRPHRGRARCGCSPAT